MSAEAVAATLNKCARLALPFVPAGLPGDGWWEITERAPRNRRGHHMPYMHTIRPLVARGLVVKIVPPRRDDGTRPPDRYHRTALGNAVSTTLTRAGVAG